MDAHRGQLFVEGNRHGLDAALAMDNKDLLVSSGDDVWRFSRRDVTARRSRANEFSLKLAGEAFVFVSRDPIRFTFDIVDELRRPGKRRPRGRRKETPPRPRLGAAAPVTKPTIGQIDQAGEMWTDLVGGRDASSLLEALSDINNANRHRHQWEDGDSHGDGALQVCVECKQVFVDLLAADPSPSDAGPAGNWRNLP